MHDPTKVLMGTTGSSDRTVTCEDADPASFPAGFAVRRTTTGGLVIADDSTAQLIGVSAGKSLSDHTKTSVIRSGNFVPLRLRVAYATGTIEITNYENLLDGVPDDIEVGGVTFVAQAGAATLGEATFRAATSNEATAISLAAQINAHETTEALVLATVDGAEVLITALEAGEDGDDIALDYTDNDDDGTSVGATVTGSGFLTGGADSADTIEIGATVYVDDVTGEGCDSGDDNAAITNAIYVSGVLTGVFEDGTTAPVALIDMPGGL